MEQVPELLKLIMENRQKRDAEIAKERRRRKEEFVADQERAKEESASGARDAGEDGRHASAHGVADKASGDLNEEGCFKAEGAKCQTGSTNGER